MNTSRFLSRILATAGLAAMMAGGGIAHAQTSNEADALKAAMAKIDALTARLAVLEAKVDGGNESVHVVDTNKAQPDVVKVTLKPGPSFASSDGKTTFAVDGRVMMDAGWVVRDGATDIGDDTDIRHLWIGFSGKNGDWRYKVQTSIDNNQLGVKDAYIAFDGIKNVPIMAGNFYENNGMEIMSGNLNTTFMESSSGIGAFRTLRYLGVSVDPYGDNWGAQIGLFGDGVADPAVTADDEGWAFASRFTIAPINTKDSVLHVGGSWRYRVPDAPADQVRFRASGESHVIGETLVDTGNITGVDNYTTAAIEAMYRVGGLSFMGEYNQTDVSRQTGADPTFRGGYAQVGWFITGEAREYNAKRGLVGKVKPNAAFAMDGGIGAWELAARYDTLDLTNSGVNGGEMDSVTLGLNWYPTSSARLMLNYVLNDLDSTGPVAFRNADPEYVMMRVQADF